MTLNPRLYTLKPHPVQYRLWTEEKRFKVVPAGRRSGKTELGKRKLIEAAYEGTMFPDARFFASAPTRDQAKRIFWTDLKAMVNMQYVSSIMESELKIEFVNASEIHVIGMDKPERIEGTPWDGGIMDEYGNMKKKAWPENVRPSLSDRMGWCWLIGVPEGRNHYYNTYREAKADTSNLWGAYHWISADILPPQEIEAAKRDLDLRTYEQEYEASFVNYAGMAYYCFDEKYSVGKLEYDPINPLIFCFDFNESPGVAVVCQEQWLPDRGDGSKIFGTGVIGEVYIPHSSNTVKVCRRLLREWTRHKGEVWCYGDATGGSGGSAKLEGSDWELIRKILRPVFRDRLKIKARKSNPRERDRVNSVNSRLCSTEGIVKMVLDGRWTTNLIKDFEGTLVVEGGSGEIDKKKYPDLSHMTDALGYYNNQEFPIKKKGEFFAY